MINPFFKLHLFTIGILLLILGCEKPLEPKGKLRGTVSIAGTSIFLEGIEVNLTGVRVQSQTTNSQGTYEFSELPTGEYGLSVKVSTSFIEESPVKVVISGNGSISKDIILTPKGSIRGSITEAGSNKPVAGANVSIIGGVLGDLLETRNTDALGVFEFKNLPDGEHVLRVFHPRYDPLERSFNVSGGQATRADLQLGGNLPVLELSTDTLKFETDLTQQVIDVINSGNGSLKWEVVEDLPWLTTNRSGGVTDFSTSLAVFIDRSSLRDGAFSGKFNIISDVGSKEIFVMGTVVTQFEVTPTFLDFGKDKNSLIVSLANLKDGIIDYDIVPSDNWISVENSTGTLGVNKEEVIVSIDRSGLAEGIYDNEDKAGFLSVRRIGISVSKISLRFEVIIPDLNMIPADWQVDQEGTLGETVNVAARLTSSDPFASLGGKEIEFSVLEGGGTLESNRESTLTAITNNAGIAEVNWTLGDEFGNQQVTATYTVNNRNLTLDFSLFANKIKDQRDGEVYSITKVGNQTWMAENLNYGIHLGEGVSTRPPLQENNTRPEKYCYEGSEANCNKYGGIYFRDELMNYGSSPRGLCPENWHVPTIAEWQELVNSFGSEEAAISGLKSEISVSQGGWEIQGTNNSGFSNLPGGMLVLTGSGPAFGRRYIDFGNAIAYWASDIVPSDDYNSNIQFFGNNSLRPVFPFSPFNSLAAGYCRCLKD